LLAFAIASVIIPMAFDISITTNNIPIAEISHGIVIILLIVYSCYLFFQLKTHNAIYIEESKKVPMRPRKGKTLKGAIKKGLVIVSGTLVSPSRTRPKSIDVPPEDELMQLDVESLEEDKLDELYLILLVALFTLAASTAIIPFYAKSIVSSINDITTSPNSTISTEFIGLILLPIIGNSTEHATTIIVAGKDKMDLAIGIVVGSNMQIVLFILPFIIIVR
jgi:Ca2+:H+ antiporter